MLIWEKKTQTGPTWSIKTWLRTGLVLTNCSLFKTLLSGPGQVWPGPDWSNADQKQLNFTT